MIAFDEFILSFIKAFNNTDVQYMVVGGAAVNFHGYQRHSADIDIWINISEANMSRFKQSLEDLGFDSELPVAVINGEQNISIKISPITEIELITKFNPGKTFEECFINHELKHIYGEPLKVIDLESLINSKVKSSRYKDLLDIHELKRIHNLD